MRAPRTWLETFVNAAEIAIGRLLAQLPKVPVVTATTLARILGVSYPAANAALDELHRAGIVSRKTI